MIVVNSCPVHRSLVSAYGVCQSSLDRDFRDQEVSDPVCSVDGLVIVHQGHNQQHRV